MMGSPTRLQSPQPSPGLYKQVLVHDVSDEEAAVTEVIIASLEFDAVEEVEFGQKEDALAIVMKRIVSVTLKKDITRRQLRGDWGRRPVTFTDN